jgi:hypothetical protein
MSLNSLLESANPYHSVQSDAARLAAKWEKTGLLEGLNGTHKSNMGMILENQAKQLVVENSNTGGGAGAGSFVSQTAVNTGGQWAGVALPLVRKVFGQIAAKEFVSVQPMNLPSGLVFFLDFQYGSDKMPFTAGNSLYGDSTNATAPFGNTNAGGLYGEGRFSYSINNTQSVVISASVVTTATPENFRYDSNYSASAGTYWQVAVPTASYLEYVDVQGCAAFQLITGSVATAYDNAGVGNQVSEFTVYNGGSSILFYVTKSVGTLDANSTFTVVYQLQPTDADRGDFEDGNPNPNGLDSPEINIPEINVQMKSSAIVAKTRKLKAVWTPEFAQDLNAYHALDAEAELTSMLSEYISLEIDLEILGMLTDAAAAGTETWSAQNNISISGAAGAQTNLGFYNSQGQWFQTLGTKINKLSNIIHQKTLRGGANFMVLSPTVATIIESIPGFAADSDGDVSKNSYAFGVQKVGALGGGKIKVYKNPYMTSNQILLGFRGTQFLESGAVFAPYIPLIMTPLVYDPNTFTPRKGLLTRYAKKMVRPEFYGTININGLNTL